MTTQELTLQELESELAVLEASYHLYTDQVGNHFETGAIVKAIQTQMIIVSGKVRDFKDRMDVTEQQEREFDKYKKLNY